MEKLTPGKTYHIYNHAIGAEDIFREDENYLFFIKKYLHYISPVAETFAYCLLPNHFHILIRIRDRKDIEVNDDIDIEKFISKQFANLFSSYTQSFNKYYSRMGSLFVKRFKRELIHNKRHFLNTVLYIHRNPVHHGFCRSYADWSYNSYSDVLEENNDVVEFEKLIQVFGGLVNYNTMHQDYLESFLATLSTDD